MRRGGAGEAADPARTGAAASVVRSWKLRRRARNRARDGCRRSGIGRTVDSASSILPASRSEGAESTVRPIPIFLHPSRAVFLAQSLIFQDRTTEAAEAVRAGMEYFPDEPRLIEQARLLGIGG